MIDAPERIVLADGLTVSRLTRGNWQLAAKHGPVIAEDVAIEGMRQFVEAGITNFDCADHYVGVEELIGAFRRRYPELAARLTVQTKIVPDRNILPGITRAAVEQIIDRARDRLGMDVLDLVQFHWWEYDAPGYVDSMLWLADMQAEGKIRHLGVTNFDCRRLEQILAAGVPLVSHQVQYSALDHRPERGMVDLCRANAIGLQCYGVLAGGFLSDTWLGRPAPDHAADRSQEKYRLIIDEFGGWDAYQTLLGALAQVAGRHSVSIAAVATRYVLDRPGVATAIVGARTDSHLADLLTITTLRLTSGDIAAIDNAAGAARGLAGDCYALERDPKGPHTAMNWKNQNLQGAGAR
ncbi:MAG: aldo/keto reductase [Proteobacteria bacterium]|nr:aldo/keto reductase [Pseudomonadota bacterium]MDA1057552.1 aldo/keto reductase [Pseudomonadota bacterium]